MIYIRSLLANKKKILFFVFLMSSYIFLTTCFSGSQVKFLILMGGGGVGRGINELYNGLSCLMYHLSILQKNILLHKDSILPEHFLKKLRILKVLKVQKYVAISGISVTVYDEKIGIKCRCVNTKQNELFKSKIIWYDVSCITVL